jgi:hypothetical protein
VRERDTGHITRVALICLTCGYKAKRRLLDQVACRGTHETASEPAFCPKGHGALERTDGTVQRDSMYGPLVVGSKRPIQIPKAKKHTSKVP